MTVKKGFRDFLAELDGAGELLQIEKPVDPRAFSTLIAQSRQAMMFRAVKEYPEWRVAGGLVSTRKRLAIAMASTEDDVAMRFGQKPQVHLNGLNLSYYNRDVRMLDRKRSG